MKTTTTSNQRSDLYRRVTERVVADLERGVRPWLKPWTGGNTRITVPHRHNGIPYRGINVLILWAEAIDRGYNHGGDSAYYSPKLDIIQVPVPEAFRDAESYAATTAHELTHWTAHPNRLNRDFGGRRFGDTGYAREELVAELGSAFLCADLGITPEPREDHASYLAHWIAVLKEDKRAIFAVAAYAQKAVDYLGGRQPNAMLVPGE